MTAPSTEQLLAELYDVVAGTGKHADHQREQIGRCVHCSCGARVQGRMPGSARPPRPRGTCQVRLADGFVAYVGPRAEADMVAARHEGATVEDAR